MSDFERIPQYAAALLVLPLLWAFAGLPPRGLAPTPHLAFFARQGWRWWVLPVLGSLMLSLTLFVPALCGGAQAPWGILPAWCAGTLVLLLIWRGFRGLHRMRMLQGVRAGQRLLLVVLPLSLYPMLHMVLPEPWRLISGRFLVALLVAALFEVALGFREAQGKLLDAEDAAARVRLSPHFLLNTLNGLHAQIEKDPEGAQATTEQLGSLFRQLLVLTRQPVVRLSEELDFVEALLAIHRQRLGGRLRIDIDCPEATLECEVPTLALQTLVENAIKHGIAPLEEGGEVRVTASMEVTRMGAWGPKEAQPADAVVTTPPDALSPAWTHLIVTVENPLGPGGTEGTGIGLESLRARLREPGDLMLESGPDTFRASLRWRQP